MSNSAFHHDNPAVTDGMIVVAGILHKHGPRSGHNHLKEFGRKLRLDATDKALVRLGNNPTAQRQVIDQALTLLVNRGLASFQRHTKTLSLTKKGERARDALIGSRSKSSKLKIA